MDARGFREKIASGVHIPPLPPVLRALFVAPERSSAWRAAIQQDPLAIEVVMEAARTESPDSAPRDLDAACARLGMDGLRIALARHGLIQCFPADAGRRLDRRAFWRHALVCARRCKDIASISKRWNPAEAYLAGLVHDIGKAALDTLTEEGYSRIIEAVGAYGITALDAERREFGADHAQVGKWVIAWWELPEPFAEAAWLHHHHPAALDGLPVAVDLIHIVAIADWVAHLADAARIGDAAMPDTIASHCAALGISRQQFSDLAGKDTVHSESIPDATVTRDAAPAGRTPPTAQMEPAIRERLQRYLALHAMNRRLATAKDRMTVLRIVGEAIRDVFGMASGLCYATREDGRAEGIRWRDASSDVIALQSDNHGAEEATKTPQDSYLRTLLRHLAPDLEALDSALVRHGLVAVPIAAVGRAFGQIIVDAADSQFLPDEEHLGDLMAFGGAAGAALARLNALQRADQYSEALATTLWKQELAFKQAARGERLAGIALLAARAAHEINNPLAAISGRAQILANRITDPEDRRAAETIIQQSRRISRILHDLLQFAQPGEPTFQRITIVPLLQQTVASRRQRLAEKKIRIVEDFAQDIPPTRADPLQLKQVFSNLLQNAEDAMSENGGTLTLRVKPVHDRRAIVIQIADTGCGIAPDALDRVFEPFFTTHTSTENSGLGLAVCHGIIERHRGAITLHGSVGKGATCTITLPAATEQDFPETTHPVPDVSDQPTASTNRPPTPSQTQATPDAPPQTPPSPTTKPENPRPLALVAEPSEELREVLAATLATQGFETVTAADGLEALAAALSKKIDLAILEFTLTATDGSPAHQYLRVRNPRMPIILLADAGVEDTSAIGFEYGVHGCLQKPFDIAALLNLTRKILAARSVA